MHADNIIVSKESILAAYRTASQEAEAAERGETQVSDMYNALDSIAADLLLQLIEAGVPASEIYDEDV